MEISVGTPIDTNLIKCCSCNKTYNIEGNLYEGFILVCPHCGLKHKIDFQLFNNKIENLKKIDKLYLTAIDIGSTASDRGLSITTSTFVDKNLAANASGKITSVDVWAAAQMAGAKIGIFYVVSGNNLTARDSETLNNGNGAGVVLSGSKQTFTVDLDVETGDYIGIYFSSGSIEKDNSGVGWWYLWADQTACSNTTFTYQATRTPSLCGRGETSGSTLKLSGTSVNEFSTTGTTLGVTFIFQGTSANAITSSGALDNVYIMAGTSAAYVEAVAGFLENVLVLQGTSINTASALSEIVNICKLSGTSVSSLTTEGAIDKARKFSGTSVNTVLANGFSPAVAIDMGSAAVEGTSYVTPAYTRINRNNPANATGKITSIQIYAVSGYNLTNTEVGIFYAVDATHFTTRDYDDTIGTVTGGGVRTFTVDLDVVVGDFIGLHCDAGRQTVITGGENVARADGDTIPCTNQEFTVGGGAGTAIMSLYGTGLSDVVNGLLVTKVLSGTSANEVSTTASPLSGMTRKLSGTSVNVVLCDSSLEVGIVRLSGASVNVVDTSAVINTTLALTGASVNEVSTPGVELIDARVEKLSGTSANVVSTIAGTIVFGAEEKLSGTSVNVVRTTGELTLGIVEKIKGTSVNVVSTIGALTTGIAEKIKGTSVNVITTSGSTLGLYIKLYSTSVNAISTIANIKVPIWEAIGSSSATWTAEDKSADTWQPEVDSADTWAPVGRVSPE